MTLEQLLNEPVAAARRREQTAFGTGSKDKIVLFGAGVLGRKVLGALRRHHVEALAFIDNDEALQGMQIEGLQVLSPGEAVQRFGTNAIFLITIFRGMGDAGMAFRERWLKTLGCRRVMNFLPVAWKYASELLPHYGAALPSEILAAAPEIKAVAAGWSDERSREVFRGQLLWRLRGDFSAVPAQAADQYFPRDLIAPRSDEAFVDGGAYDGDTLRTLGRNFSRAWAIEPNPFHAARLRSAGDPRVTVIECALGAEPGDAAFRADAGVASALSASGSTQVRTDTLDHLLEGQSPSFLKLDIEGAEQAALHGGREMLGRAKPLVAVCLYHRPDDLWKIPLFLRRTLPDHRLFLRAQQNDGYELVAYAVPPERSP